MADTWEDVPAADAWEDVPVPAASAPGGTDWGEVAKAGMMGGGSAASFGLNDEAGGAVGAIGEKLGLWQTPEAGAAEGMGMPAPPERSFGDAYRGYRDGIREVDQAARDQHGLAYHGVGLVAAAANPLGAASKGAGIGERILTAGANGALAGAGNSTADLTQGDVAGVARDTGIGTGVGLAAGAALEGVGAGARRLVGSAEGRQAARAAAEPRQVEMELGDAPKPGVWDAIMAKGAKAAELASDVWSTVAGNPMPMAKRVIQSRASDAVLSALGDAARAGGNPAQLIARAVAIGIPEETAAAVVHGNRPSATKSY